MNKFTDILTIHLTQFDYENLCVILNSRLQQLKTELSNANNFRDADMRTHRLNYLNAEIGKIERLLEALSN